MTLLLFIALFTIKVINANVTNKLGGYYENKQIVIEKERETPTNMTCEEFLMNTTFDVNRVVDIDWKIFFFWNYEYERTYNIKFSFPTSQLLDQFKVLQKSVDIAVNWSQAVLFMETSIDFSALYLVTETSGKFKLIPSFAFQTGRMPTMIFALKIVEPGYLGIMNCQHKLCYALAPVDRMPEDKNITLAAESIGFKALYNYSYLIKENSYSDLAPYAEDDSEEDEQLEIENDIEEL